MLPFFEHYSYFGLFFIILIEEAGIPLPIPGDIFIAVASALPNSNYFLIVTTVTLSTILGSTILFTLAKKAGYPLFIKYGKYIRVDEKKVKKGHKWFEKYGGFAIVVGRLIPGLRIITPFVAGTLNLSYKTFWLYTALAAFIWANIYFAIGKFFNGILSLITSG